MDFVKKTDYDYDIKLFKNWNAVFWYTLLAAALVIGPMFAPPYVLTLGVFVGIYVIAGAGLMLLSGYTGQISLGHAAFLAVGAYTSGVLQGMGVPFPIAFVAAGVLAAIVGIIVGLPALRLHGIYLVINHAWIALRQRLNIPALPYGRPFAVAITFAVVVIAL